MIEKVYIEYLILKSQEDHSYLDELLKIIQPKIIKFCHSAMSDQNLAKDATQESLLTIFTQLNKLKDHRKFHAWIYQISLNKCKDIFRRSKPHLNQQFFEDEESKILSPNQNNDLKIDLISTINTLPKLQQIVIRFFYYEGFQVNEISIILNKPAGTIKSLLFQARESIKTIYGETP